MNPFTGLGLAVDKPVRCYLFHPVTGAPLRVKLEGPDVVPPPEADWPQAYVEILSFDSRAAQEHRFARQEEERRLRRELTPAEDYEWGGIQLARMTTGWLLCDLDGNKLDVPFRYDVALALFNGLETRWLRNQVFGFALNPGNFLPAT